MLSELLERYQEAEDSDKEIVFNQFLDKLWSSKYVFKKRKKTQVFEVNEKSLHNRHDLIKLFKKYNTVEYMYCQSFYRGDLDSVDYIRVHINNMYGYLVDPHVYLPKEFYSLLWTPKKEYFKVIELLNQGEVVDTKDIENQIVDSQLELEKIKSEANKIELKFSEYKKLIEEYMKRIFNNYTPIHEYEEKHGWEMRVTVDGWSEDNFVISYFCKSLTGYMRNYVKSLQPKEVKIKFCCVCRRKIKITSNSRKYCDTCYSIKRKEYKTKKQREYREKYTVDK